MDRALLFSATTYILFGLATVFTIGRVLSRWRKFTGAGYGPDDWVSFFAYACTIGLTVANAYQLSTGLGRDVQLRDNQMVEKFFLWNYITQIFYIAVVFGTKLSLGLLYLRVFSERSVFRIACLILACALVCTFIAFEVVTIIQCLPISSIWTSFPGSPATCVDREAFAYSLTSVDIAFNVVVLGFPIRRLLKIETSPLRKTCIYVAILVGLAVTAISAVRLHYLEGLTTETNVNLYYSYIGLYSSIEAYLSQICCCIPAFVAVFDRDIIIHRSSRLSGGSRKSASTPRTSERGSGAVVGIKGIGPTKPHDLEKADLDDGGGPFEEYERAPSPTIGLSSHRSWDETITSRSQFPHRSLTSERFQRTFFDERDTPTEVSVEDLETFYEEDESPMEKDTAIRPIGIPSIVQKDPRNSEPPPQTVRLSAGSVALQREVKPSNSRMDIHSW